MSDRKVKQERKLARVAAQAETKRFSVWVIVGAAALLVCAAGAGIYFWRAGASNNSSKTASTTPDSVTSETATSTAANNNPMVVIETSKGIIKAELKLDDAPKTVRNFTDLAGKKFYDGLLFHRVVPDFVIQGGDPKGDGSGGSGTNIPLEIKCKDGTMHEGETVTCPVALPHTDGALAMARSSDPNSASSQFYITIGAQPALDGQYAVFGYVTEGLDVVRAIAQGDKIIRIYLE